MSTTIIRPNSREEWLEVRKSGIGSSEVATIVGLNPYETPYQLWRRKVGLDAPKEETFAMKAGHYLEDAVAQFWADATGQQVIKSSAGDWLIRSNERPYLQVSPDRTYWLAGQVHNNDNKGILECKTTQMSVDGDDLPKHWFCQLTYQLGVSGMQHGSLAWLTAGREFGYKDIDFDRDFYEFLVEEVERFWVDYIKGGQEPQPVNVQDVLIKYNRHTAGKCVEVGEDILEAYHQLKGLKEELAELERRKEELESTIKMGFGDAEAISFGGETLAPWKGPKDSERLNSKAVAKADPDLAREVTRTGQGARRVLLK